MRSAYSDSSGLYHSPARRRAPALALTLLVHLLLLLMLLKLTPPDWVRRKQDQGPVTFQLAPNAPKAEQRTRKAGTTKKTASKAPPPTPAPAKPPLPVPTPPVPFLIPGLEHFDLRQVRSSQAETAAADQGSAGQGQDSGSAYGPGEGPGGAKLYYAEWYREPTSAELSYYLPPGRHIGWGMIACQTVERYHVDNCRTIGDSPPGSGLARAVREAAWQFLVRPPRIDGKPVIGAWVRIRIEFTEGGAAVSASSH
jgi:protein TonB